LTNRQECLDFALEGPRQGENSHHLNFIVKGIRFSRGSMFGEPGNIERQRRIALDALEALRTIEIPGTIRELPYQWKRPDKN
jgi:hypothetical protein